jgi:hypothetical protein
MNPPPNRFILQAIDPKHGSSVFETMLWVERVEDLRAVLGDAAEDDPDLERWYPLAEAELAAINQRFGACFDPMGRETWLVQLHGAFDAPYLIHTCYELPLLLEGRKKLAVFSEVYPPEEHWNECYFTPYVEKGVIHREIDIEPFERSSVRKDSTRFDGIRTVYYTPKAEEWRIPAYKLVWQAALKSRWNEHFERMQGMLFGYDDWQMEWWIKRWRARRRRRS